MGKNPPVFILSQRKSSPVGLLILAGYHLD